MARKLASIQKIFNIKDIEGATNLQVANVLGWQTVIGKNDFKENDLIVFCEIDALLPIRPELEFLRKGCYKELPDGTKGFRLRTVKLRGTLSQGLVLPLSILPNKVIDLPDGTQKIIKPKVQEGKDVTEILGVKLWQPPIPACLHGIVKGSFPTFIPKTDETRIQILQDVLTRHKGILCSVSEKVDGTSCTYYIRDGVFGVCSRNLELLESSDNVYWQMAKQLDIENKLKTLNENVSIQGEIVGFGISGNSLKLNERKILFFSAFDIDNYKYYDHADFIELISRLGLQTVPFLDTNFRLLDDIPQLIELGKGKSIITPSVEREGIVIRSLIEKIDLQMAQGLGNGRLSFKSINPEYLLTKED